MGIVGVTLVGQIVAVPVFLSFWGQETYGEWVTLTQLTTSLTLLNLGVQAYVNNLLITHYVRGEIAEGTVILHSALRLYAVLCMISLMIVLALIGLPGVPSWLNIRTIPASHVRLIILIQGILTTYAILGGLLLSLFRVTQQLPRQLTYGLLEQLVFLFAPMTVAALGGNPLYSAAATGLLITLVVVVALRDVRRRSPYSIGLRNTTWKASLALIRPSFAFFAVTLSAQLLSTSMILLISNLEGPQSVVLFTTSLTLTNFVRIILNQGMSVLWPEITATAAAHDASVRLARWHRLSLKFGSWLILIAIAGLTLFSVPVLTLWTRGKINVDPELTLLLTAYLLAHAPALVSRIFGLATNHQGELFRAEFTTAIITLVLAGILLPMLHVRGAALALIIGQVVGTIWVIRLACQWTSDSWLRLFEDWGRAGLSTALIVVLSTIGIGYLLPGFVWQAVGLSGIILLATGLAWYTWVTPSERELVLSMVSLFISHVRRSKANA